VILYLGGNLGGLLDVRQRGVLFIAFEGRGKKMKTQDQKEKKRGKKGEPLSPAFGRKVYGPWVEAPDLPGLTRIGKEGKEGIHYSAPDGEKRKGPLPLTGKKAKSIKPFPREKESLATTIFLDAKNGFLAEKGRGGSRKE